MDQRCEAGIAEWSWGILKPLYGQELAQQRGLSISADVDFSRLEPQPLVTAARRVAGVERNMCKVSIAFRRPMASTMSALPWSSSVQYQSSS